MCKVYDTWLWQIAQIVYDWSDLFYFKTSDFNIISYFVLTHTYPSIYSIYERNRLQNTIFQFRKLKVGKKLKILPHSTILVPKVLVSILIYIFY